MHEYILLNIIQIIMSQLIKHNDYLLRISTNKKNIYMYMYVCLLAWNQQILYLW